MTIGNASTDKLITKATDKLTSDIQLLYDLRESSLNTFRTTAETLGYVNTSLQEKIGKLDDLAKFIADQKANAEKTISDNDRVRSKILDIIGE